MPLVSAAKRCCYMCRQPGQGAPAAFTKADLKVVNAPVFAAV